MKSKKYFLNNEDYAVNDIMSKQLAQSVIDDPKLPELNEIVIGCFGEYYDGQNACQVLLDTFIQNKTKLNHIESFFIGDMDPEECELSWIHQTDYSDFLNAFTNIKKLTIQGSVELSFEKLKHKSLEHLEIICGGLPQNVIKEIADCDLPNLNTLILYIGVENYGFDGEIKDLEPLCCKSLFPNLKHLGLTNSKLQDQVVEVALNGDILPQLDVLQLSYGTLTDKGGQLILDNFDKLLHLKKLDLSYHYMTRDMMNKLKQLPIQIDLSMQNKYDFKYEFLEYANNPMCTE